MRAHHARPDEVVIFQASRELTPCLRRYVVEQRSEHVEGSPRDVHELVQPPRVLCRLVVRAPQETVRLAIRVACVVVDHVFTASFDEAK